MQNITVMLTAFALVRERGTMEQLTVLLILPSVLLSGFIFPREAMPLPIRFLGNFIPLTYFLEILRGIILKGIGLEYLWRSLVILLIFGVAAIVISSMRFKKNLD